MSDGAVRAAAEEEVAGAPSSREQVHAAVVDALAAHAERHGLAAGALGRDVDVLGSGLIDSLGFVDMLMDVEEHLGAPLALELLDFERLDSLGAIVDQLWGIHAGG